MLPPAAAETRLRKSANVLNKLVKDQLLPRLMTRNDDENRKPSLQWHAVDMFRQRWSFWRSSSPVSVQLMRIRRRGPSSQPKVALVWTVMPLSSCREHCKI